MIGPLPERLYDDAVTLWHDAGLTRPWNDPAADLRRAMAGPASTVLAWVEGERLLATAMVGHDGHRAWVYYFAVVATQRRHGLGRRMMAACEAWTGEHGIPKLQLMVRRTNDGVLAFYAALGYTDADVVVLGKRLDGA